MTKSSKPPFELPIELDVSLTRGNFMYYNWTVAFDRPILPFFLYTFVGFNLVSLIGLFPLGRLFAFAAMLILLGYLLLVQVSSSLLWRRFPHLAGVKHYSFKSKSYRLKIGADGTSDKPAEAAANANISVDYDDVLRVLVSRQGYYFVRADGSADIIPKATLEKKSISAQDFTAWLETKVKLVKPSLFL